MSTGLGNNWLDYFPHLGGFQPFSTLGLDARNSGTAEFNWQPCKPALYILGNLFTFWVLVCKEKKEAYSKVICWGSSAHTGVGMTTGGI